MNLEQIKPVVGWIKGHLFIFVMSLLIVLFLGCGWYFSGGLNTQLASDIDDHKKNFQKLDKASKTSVTLPMTNGDFSASGTLNQALLDSLDELSTKTLSDPKKDPKEEKLQSDACTRPTPSSEYARLCTRLPRTGHVLCVFKTHSQVSRRLAAIPDAEARTN